MSLDLPILSLVPDPDALELRLRIVHSRLVPPVLDEPPVLKLASPCTFLN